MDTTYLEHLPERLSSSVALGGVGLSLIVGISLLVRSYSKSGTSHKGLSLAPGPKPLPLIGNLLDVPTKREWETITQWGKQYGAWSIS